MGRKLKIVNVGRSEGPLYEAQGEDRTLYCFDSTVTALAEDGKVYRHTAFVVRGALQDPDGGFKVPNYNYKNEVQAFVAKVQARGTIDLRYWEEVVEESPEEREAYNLKCEQDERAWWGMR